ncbi:hypothetical protein ACXVUM_12575 [Williamsia sp. SKLECPSW1]
MTPGRARIAVHLVATAVAVAGATSCGQSPINRGAPPTGTPTTTRIVEINQVVDTSDLVNLVAISTNIFSGRVDSATASRALNPPLPETQFAVTTAASVKGSAAPSVTLNQQGGVRDGVYFSVDGDRPLRIGQWYLFYTRYLASENWYTVVPVHGHVEVTESQARDRSSAPLAAAADALRASPRNLSAAPSPARSSPTLTFPPPPGDEFPPPPTPAQPR